MVKLGVVLALIGFVFFAVLFAYNIEKLFAILDAKEQQETEDKIFLEHGCHIDHVRNVYVCPNGLPPGQ